MNTSHHHLSVRRLLLALLLTAVAGTLRATTDDTLFLYFTDGTIQAFPYALIREADTSGDVRLTLINDSVVFHGRAELDSISNWGPDVPAFESFKFNNKFNENLSYDIEADTITEYMAFTIPAIGKRLTASFKVNNEDAGVFIGNRRQTSKVSRNRFDHDVIYTVSLPGATIFSSELVSEEVWSEEVWSDPIEELKLRAEQLSTNQPNNHGGEGLDMLLDDDIATYFHCTWGSIEEQKSENCCLDISLDSPLTTFRFYYCTRPASGYNPLAFTIWASNDGVKWDKKRDITTADGMPEYAAGAEYTSPDIDLGAPYTHLRFELTEAEHSKMQEDGFLLYYLVLSEFRLYRVNDYSERTLIKPSELIEPAVWWYGMKPFGHDYTVHVDWLTDSAPSVPRIDIDIDGGQMVSSKDYYLHANFKLDGMGVWDNLEDSVWIKGRGNSSWAGTWGKSPYRLKFNEKVKPFGLTKGKSWCLIANAQTGSMMANAVGMKAARQIGTAGACHVIPIDLYINGDYRGSYTFTEKVGISNNSIDIDESMGYLLELDSYYDEYYRFYSDVYRLPVNLKAPDLTEEPFVSGAKERFNAIADHFDTFVNAIYNHDGYEDMMDLDAFARFFFVNDLVNNMELGHPKSTFLYRENYEDPESPYVFGPVWDLDWAFGYENHSNYYQYDATTSIFSKMTGQAGNNFFMALMDNSEEVRKAYYRVWVEFMRNYYDEFVEYPQDYFEFANSSFLSNANYWGDGRSYEASIPRIRNWFSQRTAWIMDNIEKFELEDEPDYLTQGDVNADGVYSVADVVCLVAYLLGQDPGDFDFRQADVDCNNEITITDLVCVIDFVLKAEAKGKAAPLRSPAEWQYVMPRFQAFTGEECEADIVILPGDEADEDISYTATTFTLTLPEGMTLRRASLADCASTHHVATYPIDDRHVRILVYSDTDASLPAGSMVRLTLSADNVIAERQRVLSLSDGLLATAEGDEHRAHATSTTFDLGTGISTLAATCRIEGGHVLTITALDDTHLDIYRADGSLIESIDVQAGTTTLTLPSGVYTANGQKVVIL